MAGFRLLLFNLLLLLLLVDGYILKEKVQDYASDEGDEDLSIPENAKGRDGWTPPPRRRPGNYANAKREDVEENRCYCTYGDDGCGAKDYCVKDVGAACFHAVEQNVIYEEGRRRVVTLHRYGCAPLERGSDASHLTCNAWRISHYIPRSIACCYEGKLCNQDLEVPPYSGHFDWDDDGEGADKVQLLFSRSSILCIFLGATAIIVALLYFAYIGHKARTNGEFRWLPRKKQSPLYEENHEKSPILADASSGSGSGMPTLSQRTVAQELKYLGEPPLGRGRYGEVKKALYRGSYVAVKTFSTRDEESWKNERDVYQTQMLNHENILQFVAADITSVDSMTQMLLITDYHKFGSLADYLDREPTLTIHEALELAYSAMCGIEHLHNPVHGTGSRRKPEIAHRDIKSKNVIVKRPGVCCIADFGLAVTFDKDGMHPPKVNIQVGTKRYMAPEVLSKTLNPESFGQFKMADMYSFALVLWEIARRVEIGNERVAEGPLPAAAPLGGYSSSSSGIGSSVHSSSEFRPQEQKKSEDNSTAKKYEPPFEGMVDHDPSLDQMALIVCTQKKRPPVEEAWLAEGGNASLRVLCNLMLDCWHETPGCRHTALKVKKELRRALDALIETSQTATTTTSSPTDALSTSSR